MTAEMISACATGVLALATSVVAYATMRYALGTRALAAATLEGVNAQTVASEALIAANHTVTNISVRAHVVSTTRLAWMDSVRDAVAEFLSLDHELKDSQASELGHEFRDNLNQRRLMIRYRIEFRLDPDKRPHANLLKAIDALIIETAHSEEIVRDIRSLTISIMEEEWRRVRREVGAAVSADSNF